MYISQITPQTEFHTKSSVRIPQDIPRHNRVRGVLRAKPGRRKNLSELTFLQAFHGGMMAHIRAPLLCAIQCPQPRVCRSKGGNRWPITKTASWLNLPNRSILYSFWKKLQSRTWNRRSVRTSNGKLRLAPGHTK